MDGAGKSSAQGGLIAFVQPFGLRDSSGGGRILRALLAEAPVPFLSICTSVRPPAPPPFGREVHLPPRPFFGRLEATRFARYLHWVAEWRRPVFEQALEQTILEAGALAIHAIPHGADFWYAYQIAERHGLPYILNIHDDLRYNLAGHPKLEFLMDRLAYVWQRANARIVISDAMGEAYSRWFGFMPYEVITDGLPDALPQAPRVHPPGRAVVYFMGALHLSYHRNFYVLARSLDLLRARRPGWQLACITRGSRLPVRPKQVPVRELPYAPETEVARDFDQVDVLYLPLPFGEQYAPFTRYSLSTKLVTYLGSGLPILYHGPADAAAAQLLARYGAAVQVHTLDAIHLSQAIEQALEERERLVEGALRLAYERFRLSDQRERFWQLLRRVDRRGT
jgi:glycosyltransferase involved in cell wall biosynthesis